MDTLTQEVQRSLLQKKLTGLHIDESGVRKKGKYSVAVGHQYCGNLGKTDNCQVGVFASLNNSDYASLIDSRIYLPRSWTTDKKRCDKAGIPEEHRIFKTKQ